MADHSRRLVLNRPQSKMGMERCSFCLWKNSNQILHDNPSNRGKGKKRKVSDNSSGHQHDRALLIEAAVRQKAKRTVRSYRPSVSIRSPGPTSLQQPTRRPGSICPRLKFENGITSWSIYFENHKLSIHTSLYESLFSMAEGVMVEFS
jgi:hypothetical protein